MINRFIFYFLIFMQVLGASGQENRDSLLVKAIRDGNTEILDQYLNSSIINYTISKDYGNALLCAIHLKSTEMAEFLLKKGADPDCTFRSLTPLMYAVRTGEISVIRSLLKYGADINRKDSMANTALMMASANSKLPVVKLLIRKGASLNDRNKKGHNARDFAVRSTNRNISNYLKNVFERNLPDYFDGPYVNFQTPKKIRVTYLRHDSLKHRSEASSQYFQIRKTDGQFTGFAGDAAVYPLADQFKRPPSVIENKSRLLIIGDIHGQYDSLRIFLQHNRVIDQNLHWCYGNGTVIFMGDIFDRGDKVTEALWLIYRLEKEAEEKGGVVQLLLGNHELMIFQENERFISEKYFYLFKDLKLSYSRYYNNKTLLGRWLRSRNTFLRIDSFLLVHGGLHPNILKYSTNIDSANELVNEYLTSKRKNVFENNQNLQFLLSFNGPYWFRGMVEPSDDNSVSDQQVEELLTSFKAKHIVVGHTFKPEIKSFYNGKVISTDVPFYLPDGYPMQALLVEDHKFLILNTKGQKKDLYLQ